MQLPASYELQPGERIDPLVWITDPRPEALPLIENIDLSDEALDVWMGKGQDMRLKSFGHDTDGVHFLLTRKGTGLHNDVAFTRFTHQLVLRNDGNRLRGLPKYDDPETWHRPLVPGVMYCLDSHSAHEGLADPRFENRGRGMKAVLAVDRNEPLEPDEVYALFEPWLERGTQFLDVAEPGKVKGASPRWKPSA